MAELVSALILMLSCTVIGVRLLFLAARTRKLPELLIGGSFVLAGTAASVLDIVRSLAHASPEVNLVLFLASRLFLQLGVACVATFTWRVFRPDDAIGRVMFALLAGVLVLSYVGEAWDGLPVRDSAPSTWFWVALLARIATYLWSSVESFRYWLQLRRRSRIGLADPLVTNRILLWSAATFMILFLWLRTFVFALQGHVTSSQGMFATVVVMACAATIWVAFFPPEAWKRLFTRSAAVPAVS